MLANILSSTVIGVDAGIVEVEVDITKGLPFFAIVGLPEVSVKESKERIKSAITNLGYRLPYDRIVVNLAPANCVNLMKMSPLTAVLQCPYYEKGHYSNESERAAEVPSVKDGNRW